MTSEHIPQHVSRTLAGRTVASVLSTVVLVLGVGVSVSGVAAGVIRGFSGPVPDIPLVEVRPAEP